MSNHASSTEIGSLWLTESWGGKFIIVKAMVHVLRRLMTLLSRRKVFMNVNQMTLGELLEHPDGIVRVQAKILKVLLGDERPSLETEFFRNPEVNLDKYLRE
jgi:hypothetical protein